MKIIIDAGHGKDARKPREMDLGLLSEDGTTETGIVREYATRLCGVMLARRIAYGTTNSGNVARRLSVAITRKADHLISLHMSQDSSLMPGGRILYATEGSLKLALALTRTLKIQPPVRVDETHGLLRFNASVEIELGNMLCIPQMRDLRSVAYCVARCNAIADAVETL